jgi:hypothetical protein
MQGQRLFQAFRQASGRLVPVFQTVIEAYRSNPETDFVNVPC